MIWLALLAVLAAAGVIEPRSFAPAAPPRTTPMLTAMNSSASNHPPTR